MTDTLLGDVMRALELFGIERTQDAAFVALTPPPPWLTPILGLSAGTTFRLVLVFPFLDEFLRQAEAMWHDGTATRIVSGAFTAAAGPDDLLLRATALTLGTRCVIVMERLHGDADPRPVLQRARENRLEQERLAGQIDALRTSMASAAGLVRELLKSGLTAEQHELAAGLDSAIARAVSVADGSRPPAR